MAEQFTLAELQVVGRWLNEQIDICDRALSESNLLNASRDVVDERYILRRKREQVRFEIDALQTRITREAIVRQGGDHA